MVKLIRSTGAQEQVDRALLSESALEDLHREELRACYAANPENPFSMNHPLDKLHSKHRQEWEDRIKVRDKLTTAADRETARKARKEAETAAKEAKLAAKAEKATQVRPAPAERRCLDCDEIIPPTGKRGRPPTRCDPCKAKFEAKQAEIDPNRECGGCRLGRGRHLKTCSKSQPTPKRKLIRKAKS